MEAVRSKKKRKHRRWRVFKRILLMAFVGVLLYGVYGLGRLVYQRVFFPPVRYEQAQAVDSAIFAGDALMLREELALVTGRAGVLNMLVDHGARVHAGQSLFEIVDKSLLSSIDTEIAREAADRPGEAAPEAVIVERRQQLTEALSIVRSLSSEVALSLRDNETTEMARAMRELRRATENARRRQDEYAFATRSETLEEERRASLLAQRQQAVHVVRANIPGYLSYAPDERVGSLKVSEYMSVTIDMVRQEKSVLRARANGERVPAGQAVGVVIDPAQAMLIFEAPETLALPKAVDIAFGETVVMAEALPRMLTGVEGKVLVPLRLTNPPFAALEQRTVNVVVRPRGEPISSIPSSSLVVGAETVVFVKTENGEHVARTVRVVATKGDRTHVTGLIPLETVVVNPGRLPPKAGTP
ncbi:MAG: hypothetical protein KGZ92_04585 [Firmicutes bacterium]|nr:hypothetical protein [Dethiobacter sp.]MBS3888562.1 hypothetical protein [Bacillota bacterium]